MRSVTALSFRAAVKTLFSLVTTSPGVPAGDTSPNQPTDSYPSRPREPDGHTRHPECAVDLHPRAGSPGADGPTRLDDALTQSAPLRHRGGDRWPADLAHPQPSEPSGRDFRVCR